MKFWFHIMHIFFNGGIIFFFLIFSILVEFEFFQKEKFENQKKIKEDLTSLNINE